MFPSECHLFYANFTIFASVRVTRTSKAMQTTANWTVANPLPKNEVNSLTILISSRYIPFAELLNYFGNQSPFLFKISRLCDGKPPLWIFLLDGAHLDWSGGSPWKIIWHNASPYSVSPSLRGYHCRDRRQVLGTIWVFSGRMPRRICSVMTDNTSGRLPIRGS